MRLAVVTKMLSPYRNPIFSEISSRPGLELLVLTFSEDQVHRQWDMNELYSQNRFSCKRLAHGSGSLRVWRGLRQFDPDVVVIGGYDNRASVEALLFCKVHQKKCVLWSGTTERSSRRRGFADVVRRAFIRSVDSFIAYGSMAREFLVHRGAAPEKIVIGYNSVDNAFFAERAGVAVRTQEYRILRERIGPVGLLFVGRLIESKGLSKLLEALQGICGLDFTLSVLGDGPLRAKLEADARKCSFKVFFEGFRSASELPLYYAACDVLVFPTLNDIWGLVVNEAMACGKPVVSSTEAGVSYDLVKQGINGWVVDPCDTLQLSSCLEKLIADGSLRRQMGQASLNIVRQFTPEALADAVVTAASLTGSQNNVQLAHGGL